MKNIFVFIIFCVSQIAISQTSGDVIIEWAEGKYQFSEDYQVSIPWFRSESFVYDGIKKSVFYSKRDQVQGVIDEQSLQISNLVFRSEERRVGKECRL